MLCLRKPDRLARKEIHPVASDVYQKILKFNLIFGFGRTLWSTLLKQMA
jgi:hypothetical protein